MERYEPVPEFLLGNKDTKLAMIVDPPEQSPQQAAARVEEFLQKGGSAVLIGGSGKIEPDVFHNVVVAVTQVTSDRSTVPVWILPGHIDQIPQNRYDLAGVFNYKYIMGSEGSFDEAYPPEARARVAVILSERQIPSISTLYILCGDPVSSVSRVSGIKPLDFSFQQSQERFLKDTQYWLERNVDCVFFESGSNSQKYVDRGVVLEVRQLIDTISPETLLIVSGGIRTPDQARLFANIADYVNVGGQFERNGVGDVQDFVFALRV